MGIEDFSHLAAAGAGSSGCDKVCRGPFSWPDHPGPAATRNRMAGSYHTGFGCGLRSLEGDLPVLLDFPPPSELTRPAFAGKMVAMSFLAVINTIWRVPLILMWTMAMGLLSVIFSVFDSSGKLQHWCARTWSRMILLVSRVKPEVRGLAELKDGGPYIFVSNHLSMFDIWAFLACLPFQFRFVAKESLFKWPFLGWHLRRSGNIPLDRSNPRKALRSLKEAGVRIRSGVSVVVFPEGSRTGGNSVAPFKRGSFFLAREAGVPLVPVTIIGSHALLPKGSVVIHPGPLQVLIHEPLGYDRYKDLKVEQLAEKLHGIVAGSYREAAL